MTEDEAKTKWCPFARASEGALAAGRLVDLKCIGSACMAWRWKASNDNRPKIEAIKAHRERTGASLQASKDAVERDWVEPRSEGWCGLAGAPR